VKKPKYCSKQEMKCFQIFAYWPITGFSSLKNLFDGYREYLQYEKYGGKMGK